MGALCGKVKKYEEVENIPLDSFTDIKLKTLEGEVLTIKDLKDQGKAPILIVNVSMGSPEAEKQLSQLQKLYSDYNKKGFEILAFECHQFMDT